MGSWSAHVAVVGPMGNWVDSPPPSRLGALLVHLPDLIPRMRWCEARTHLRERAGRRRGEGSGGEGGGGQGKEGRGGAGPPKPSARLASPSLPIVPQLSHTSKTLPFFPPSEKNTGEQLGSGGNELLTGEESCSQRKGKRRHEGEWTGLAHRTQSRGRLMKWLIWEGWSSLLDGGLASRQTLQFLREREREISGQGWAEGFKVSQA